MNKIARFAAPVALVFAAFGAQAHTIEIDYPAAHAAAPAFAYAPASPAALYLIQSNGEGPQVNPAFLKSWSVTSPVAPSATEIAKPWGPAANA